MDSAGALAKCGLCSWTQERGTQLSNTEMQGQGDAPIQAEQVQQPQVRQARDKSQYVRQQKGHSLTKHLLFGWIILWIPAIYYSFSPNHYWHA